MIFEVLSKLEDMGINVVAAISDQRRNFMKLDSLLGITVDKHYICHNEGKYFLFVRSTTTSENFTKIIF